MHLICTCTCCQTMKSRNDLGWRYFKDYPVPSLWHGQGHFPLDKVAQSCIQPGLEHLRWWGILSFSGHPVPVLHHTQSKEFFHNDLPVCHFWNSSVWLASWKLQLHSNSCFFRNLAIIIYTFHIYRVCIWNHCYYKKLHN